jgi:hypothetical protein
VFPIIVYKEAKYIVNTGRQTVTQIDTRYELAKRNTIRAMGKGGGEEGTR